MLYSAQKFLGHVRLHSRKKFVFGEPRVGSYEGRNGVTLAQDGNVKLVETMRRMMSQIRAELRSEDLQSTVMITLSLAIRSSRPDITGQVSPALTTSRPADLHKTDIIKSVTAVRLSALLRNPSPSNWAKVIADNPADDPFSHWCGRV